MRQRTMVGIASAGLAALGLVAAGAVVANRDDQASRERIPLGGGGAASGGSQAERSAAPSMAAADSKLMAGPVEYVIQGDLAPLDGPARAWKLAPEAGLKAARVAELAKALGVPGDVTELGPDQGNGWRVGAEDGSTP